MKKDIKTQERFIELRAMGWSYDRISKELSTSKPTLIGWAKSYKTELANAKTTFHDGLLATFKMQREERIRFLGGEFAKAREALKGRDLGDMPTEKLLDYTLKLLAAVKADAALSEFHGEHDFVEDTMGPRTVTWAG